MDVGGSRRWGEQCLRRLCGGFKPSTSGLWGGSPKTPISAYLNYSYEFTIFSELSKMRQDYANCDIPTILGQAYNKEPICDARFPTLRNLLETIS